jgi:hypothetical protein
MASKSPVSATTVVIDLSCCSLFIADLLSLLLVSALFQLSLTHRASLE